MAQARRLREPRRQDLAVERREREAFRAARRPGHDVDIRGLQPVRCDAGRGARAGANGEDGSEVHGVEGAAGQYAKLSG